MVIIFVNLDYKASEIGRAAVPAEFELRHEPYAKAQQRHLRCWLLLSKEQCALSPDGDVSLV